MFQAKRSFPIVPLPVDGGTSEHKLTRGMVMAGVVVSALYSVNVTGAGAAVRSRSIPMRRISLIGDNGKTLQAWRAQDLITLAQVFEQTPAGSLLVPASGFGVANYTNLEAHVPLMFEQPGAWVKNRDATALPSFGYSDLTLRIEWGSVTDLLTGTPTGAITFTAQGATVTQLDYADLPIAGGAQAVKIYRSMPVAVNRYAEMVQGAVANSAAEIDLGTTADIRAIILTSELTSTGEPTNTIVNKVSLQEDNANYVFSSVPWTSIRADNAKAFGQTMPTGVAVIDFADDGDMFHIYRASRKSKVKVLLDTAAIAGTVRAAVLTIEPPPVN